MYFFNLFIGSFEQSHIDAETSLSYAFDHSCLSTFVISTFQHALNLHIYAFPSIKLYLEFTVL